MHFTGLPYQIKHIFICLNLPRTLIGFVVAEPKIELLISCRSNKSLQKYFAALDQSLQGMELVECYGAKFDKTKHGSLFLSKVKELQISTGCLKKISPCWARWGHYLTPCQSMDCLFIANQ